MNKIRKILVAICVFMMIILVSGNVNAFLVFAEETTGVYGFFPRIKDGHWTFCVEPGGMYRASLYSWQYNQYPLGSSYPEFYKCVICSPGITPPWDGEKRYMEYTQTGYYNALEHQDAAYILADAIERGALQSWETAYSLWNSTVSSPRVDKGYALSKEAAAYKTFYEQTHSGTTDVFNSKIIDQTNTESVNVGVNQSNGTYTVGPFKVSYPDGQYNKKNIFSWINSVKAVTDVGTLDVELLSSGGGKIEISELGKDGSETLNEKEFYIRFSSTSATNVKVQIDFEYLESCSAQMLQYTGKHKYRYWEKKTTSNWCRHYYTGWAATGIPDDPTTSENESGYEYTYHIDQDGYKYVLKERNGAATQTLMALAGTATKNYKTTSKIIGGSGIDLTMKIAGTVFLDQDTGKVNEGNNKSDSGEGLPGVEVYLYQAGGSEVGRTHTDSNGNYSFSGLNSQKDYYVTFVYNAMLYTNVERLLGNADDISKATEDVTQYPNNRQNFNNKFAEISSNPQNYKIINKVFGNELGDYNKVYLQEEVADLFKEVASNYGDISKWKNADIETKRKVQFVVDCRITAYSSVYNDKQKAYQIQTYPLLDVFTVDSSWNNIAGQGYNPIYAGAYSQLHVNLGIKARPTFDLALYKDVLNAKVDINGKSEIYTYDARKDVTGKGLGVGVSEEWFVRDGWAFSNLNDEIKQKYNDDDMLIRDKENVSLEELEGSTQQTYIQQLRKAYMKGEKTQLNTTDNVDTGSYTHEFRTEEIINGNNTNEDYRKDWLNDKTLYGSNYETENTENKYAWSGINHLLSDADKLQIHVTYKIALRNQSNVVGSVTEIVDYYDSNYDFERAYIGDEDGNEISDLVDVRDENGNELQQKGVIYWEPTQPKTGSIYGTATQKGAGGAWGLGKDATEENPTRQYKTIYLNPSEKLLYADDKEQYIYITFGLNDPETTLIDAKLPSGGELYTYNLAEINGYKTYATSADYKAYLEADKAYAEAIKNSATAQEIEKLKVEVDRLKGIAEASSGLVDRDSNPGNLDPTTYVMGETKLEDDTSKAPTYVYSYRTSRTIEGTVFEDEVTSIQSTNNKIIDEYNVYVNESRFGSGTIGNGDTNIAGVKVELVEIKNGKLVVRQTTYTNANGWYGFGAFLPGDYTIRFTYGADDQTALTKDSQYKDQYIQQYKQAYTTANGVEFNKKYGLEYNIINSESYNGQDYESTKYETKAGETITPKIYEVDDKLKNIYDTNNAAKNSEEKNVEVSAQVITKYERDDYYWFADADYKDRSDATDDGVRRSQVNDYATSEYSREITNHKAEVFNSYINQKTLREAESTDKEFDEFTQAQPMEEEVADAKNRDLVNELERRTYMYAYTPEIEVEVEYTKEQIGGNLNKIKLEEDKTDYYLYKITGVDFGVVERPRAQLTIDQDVKHIKVTASDGSVLFDTENGVNNLQWIAKGDTSKYDKNELINIILDDELLSGSKLEVTYNITVTNNSEAGIGHTRAANIVNYVANNLNFDLSDNGDLWQAVKKESIQTDKRSTWINNAEINGKKLIDLSTQTTVLMATQYDEATKTGNPLTKALNPGESVTSTLTLKKTLSAESSSDDLSYSNLTEIVEIDNEVGRYDHGAIPGNQSLEEQPREHDTSGSSRYDETDNDSGTENVKTRYPQDGEIIVTPPTGSKMIYYVLGITATLILALGIILIKKFVIRKK